MPESCRWCKCFTCSCTVGMLQERCTQLFDQWTTQLTADNNLVHLYATLHTKYERLLAAAKAAEEHTWGDEGQAQEILADAIREAEGDGTKKEAEQ